MRRDWAGPSPNMPTTITSSWPCATGGCSWHGRGGPCRWSPRPWATSVSLICGFFLRAQRIYLAGAQRGVPQLPSAIRRQCRGHNPGRSCPWITRVVFAGRREVGYSGARAGTRLSQAAQQPGAHPLRPRVWPPRTKEHSAHQAAYGSRVFRAIRARRPNAYRAVSTRYCC
jgi:hypothetical protein